MPVISIGTPSEDAYRRDLTINSLFYNVNTEIVEDHTGRGFRDLQSGLISTPLDALVTLLDDPLRSLRAVRFACRFQFRLADDLLAACMDPRVRSALQVKVSIERIGAELENMLEGPRGTRAIAILYKMGMFSVLIRPPDDLEGFSADSLLISTDNERGLKWGVSNALVASELCRYIAADGTKCEILDSGENIRLVRLAALLAFGDGIICRNPLKPRGSPILLLEYVLYHNFKIRSKDVDSIVKIREVYPDFVHSLELVLSSRSNEINRLQLGLLVRAAGVRYEYAAALAASVLIMRRTVDVVGSTSADPLGDIISAISGDLSSDCSFLACNSGDNQVLAALLDQCSAVHEALRKVLDLIQIYNVSKAWALKPLINGKDIVKVSFFPTVSSFYFI